MTVSSATSRSVLTGVERALRAAETAEVGGAAGVTQAAFHTGPAHYLHSPDLAASPLVAAAQEVRFPASLSELTSLGRAGGSGDATLMQDLSGTRWVVKSDGPGLGPNAVVPPGHAAEEVLTDDVLRALGVPAPPSTLVQGKKVSLYATDSIPSGNLLDDAVWAATLREGAAEDFPGHAWVANWDAFAKQDNLRVRFDGRGGLERFNVDTGNGLRRRARGELKGNRFGEVPLELWTMREAPTVSGKRNWSKEYVGDLGFFKILDALEPMLARRPAMMEALAREPEVARMMEKRGASLEYIFRVGRELQQRGMREATVDQYLRSLMMGISEGAEVPTIAEAVARGLS